MAATFLPLVAVQARAQGEPVAPPAATGSEPQQVSPAPTATTPPAASEPPVDAPVVDAAEPAPAAAEADLDTRAELASLRAELDELREEQRARAAEQVEELDQEHWLQIYGFMDVGLKKVFAPEDPLLGALVERKLTFVLGHMNLYFDARPDPSWRSLIEARLGTYPHGDVTIDSTGVFRTTDTRVYDANSPSGRNRVIWGGVVLERAQIEYTRTNWFNLRMGYFLTPYGIWNVDHGIPTLISSILPQFQVGEAIPQRQLGVEAFGSEFSGSWELGYSAYVSNGRTQFLVDNSDGKAVGARLTATHTGDDHSLRFGTSGYVGDALEYSRALDFTGGTLAVAETTAYHYDEWAAGGDVSWDWGDFRLRTEALVHRVKYRDGQHEPSVFGAPGRFRPSRYESFGYAILAYRLGAYEPYTYTELFRTGPRDGSSDLSYIPSVGLNVHFSPFTQLKLQYVAPKFYYFDDATSPPSRDFRMIDARLVMSF